MIQLNDEDAAGNAVAADDDEDDEGSQVSQRCEMWGSAGQPLCFRQNQGDPGRQQPCTARDLVLRVCACACVCLGVCGKRRESVWLQQFRTRLALEAGQI